MDSLRCARIYDIRRDIIFGRRLHDVQRLGHGPSSLPYLSIYHYVDDNPYAAIPSLHAGYSFSRAYDGLRRMEQLQQFSSYHALADQHPTWAKRIQEFADDGADVWAYFDNDQHGFAIENARYLREKLGIKIPA